MSTEAPETRRRRKEERPDEILAAALTVFVRDGFSGARLDEIAELAGCTKGTIYVYFDSKEALFKAVVHKLITPQFRQADSVLLDESLDTETRIRRFVKGAFAQVGNESSIAVLRLLIADGPKFPDLVEFYHSEIPRIGYDMMKATLERGIARGEIRPVDTEMAPHIIFAPLVADNLRRLLGATRPIDLGALMDTHLDIVFNGLLAKR